MTWHEECYYFVDMFVHRPTQLLTIGIRSLRDLLFGVMVLAAASSATCLAEWTITDVSLARYDIERKETRVNTEGTNAKCPGIFVQITASGPDGQTLVGLGDILMRSAVTNETGRDAWAGALKMRNKLLGSTVPGTSPAADLKAARNFMHELREIASRQILTIKTPPAPERQLRATLCGFDMALLDLVGQIHGQSIAQLLNESPRDRLDISTISLGTGIQPDEIGQAMRELHPSFRAVRLEVGKDPARDLENVREIAQYLVKVKSDTGLALVVSGAWQDAPTSLSRLKEITEVLSAVGFSGRLICEQPTSVEDWDAMAEVTKQTREWNSKGGTSVVIMANESLWDTKDVATLLEKQAADAVNLKIQKAGGLLEAFDMVSLLQERAPNVEVYIGGLTMTDICAYANLQLGLAVPRLDSISGALPRGAVYDLQPATSPLKYASERTLEMPTSPGLGTALDLGAISPAILKIYPETPQ